jgi:hypothetical protein
VGNIPTSEIQVNAPPFQFKRNVGQGGAGVVHVWRDPADGKTHVINGQRLAPLRDKSLISKLS